MSTYSVWILDKSQITTSGGTTLDGVTQGTGVHLIGQTLRLDSRAWQQTFISDDGTDFNFDDNDGNQVLNGAQTINGVTYNSGTQIEAEYRLTLRDPASGQTWRVIGYNVVNSNPAFGTIEGLAFIGPQGGFPPTGVNLQVIAAVEGPGSGGQPAINSSGLVAPICFAGGSLIDTENGPVAAEELTPGTMVTTVDGTAHPLRACLRREVTRAELVAEQKLRPVRISAGALGRGLPRRDLLVSRQHRMLVSSRIASRMFQYPDVLVAAIRLTALPGIRIDDDVQQVTYIHLVFDENLVLFAEGAPSESLLIGPEAKKSLDAAAYAEVSRLFPDLVNDESNADPARFIPPNHAQKALVARHVKQGLDLLA